LCHIVILKKLYRHTVEVISLGKQAFTANLIARQNIMQEKIITHF